MHQLSLLHDLQSTYGEMEKEVCNYRTKAWGMLLHRLQIAGFVLFQRMQGRKKSQPCRLGVSFSPLKSARPILRHTSTLHDSPVHVVQ